MKNKLSAVLVCLLIINIVIGAVPVSAENQVSGIAGDFFVDSTVDIIEKIIAFKEKKSGVDSVQSWLDGALTDGAGINSEWYVIALRQYDCTLDFSSYADALKAFVSENRIASATSRQKLALAMIACGQKEDSFVKATLEDSIGEQGIISLIFGLHLLNNGVKSSKYSVAEIVEKLLSLRFSDGGWALTGEYSDVDVTAMTVQSLAPYYETDENVKAAIDGALELLGKKQLDDGDYQSYGTENPESTAQVIVALSAVGINAMSDERFIKNNCTLFDGIRKYRLDDGSFCHTEGGESNISATTQVFYSLVSLYRMYFAMGPLYVFDSEAVIPPNETSKFSDTSAPSETAEHDSTSETVKPSEAALPPADESNVIEGVSYKVWACIAVVILMLIFSLILWLCKKRHFKNYIFILIIGIITSSVVIFTNFRTKDNYYGGTTSDKTDIIGTVTLTIRCDTIVGKSDSEYIPIDGIILPVTEFEIEDGDSVFDILTEAAQAYNIQMENEGSVLGAHGMIYISGINYLYEFDFGDLSGWVYHVNGVAPSVGCGDCALSDGDAIEWLYTCNLGEDVK